MSWNTQENRNTEGNFWRAGFQLEAFFFVSWGVEEKLSIRSLIFLPGTPEVPVTPLPNSSLAFGSTPNIWQGRPAQEQLKDIFKNLTSKHEFLNFEIWRSPLPSYIQTNYCYTCGMPRNRSGVAACRKCHAPRGSSRKVRGETTAESSAQFVLNDEE